LPVGSAPFVRRRCDCLASSAPFTNIQTYLLTYLPDNKKKQNQIHIKPVVYLNSFLSVLLTFGTIHLPMLILAM